MQKVGIDPSSRRGQRVVDALLENDDLSTDEAIALTDQTSLPALSKEQRRKVAVRDVLQSLLTEVPTNMKLQVISDAVAEAVFELMGPVSPFTITPKRGAVGLSGARRDNVLSFSSGIDREVAG